MKITFDLQEKKIDCDVPKPVTKAQLIVINNLQDLLFELFSEDSEE